MRPRAATMIAARCELVRGAVMNRPSCTATARAPATGGPVLDPRTGRPKHARMSEAPKQSPLASPEPWSLVSDDYSLELLPLFERFSRDALELAPTPAGARLLDVAAGPGTLTLLAAEAGRSLAAIDFSPQMVANLKRRLNGAQLGADVRLGDGQALPWEDGQFDAAFSMFGLMFFPDRARGFAELLRVLKPGGVAVVSSWAPFEGIFKSVMESLRE